MAELLLDQIEELEDKIMPLLKRRGINVSAIQPIGLIGRGAKSTVFSLLVNGEHHVLKVYTEDGAFESEIRNRNRLHQTSEVVLSSRRPQNSLDANLLMTKVPAGRELRSGDLVPKVKESLGRHLLELHRIRRRRIVNIELVASRLARTKTRALAAAQRFAATDAAQIAEIHDQASAYLRQHSTAFKINRSLIHGDLWWTNIIVTADDVYLIDWESVRTGDYLEDFSKLRVMFDHRHFEPTAASFWQGERDVAAADGFVAGLVELSASGVDDQTTDLRLKFYLALYSFMRLRDMMIWSEQGHDVATMAALAATDLLRYWRFALSSEPVPS